MNLLLHLIPGSCFNSACTTLCGKNWKPMHFSPPTKRCLKVKKCPVCRSEVKGRKDKIYCSDTCKSSYQYERRAKTESFYLQVDRQLKINRKILKRYNQTGYTTLRKEALVEQGFNPKYFTHYWKNQNGEVYLFCFDFGFLEIERQGKRKYLLVEWQSYMENNNH